MRVRAPAELRVRAGAGVASARLDRVVMQFRVTGGKTHQTIVALALAGCSSSGGGGGDDESTETTSITTTSNERFDVGGGESGEGSAEGGMGDACKKVDVILAVDNSGSMQEELDALRGPVFDSLPMQLLDVGNGIDDFDLAVIDACPKPALYHTHGAGGACNFSTGANYMSSNSPDLTGEFQCVSDMSANGYMDMPDDCEDSGDLKDDDEQPALTAAESVSVANVMGANGGFSRDDAVLFVTAITDEDEELLGTDVDSIVQSIIAAKGNVKNVVFLGVGGGSDCDGPYGGALAADNLHAITDQFIAADRGVWWDLCDGDLEGAFAAAIEVLDSACDEYVPPG